VVLVKILATLLCGMIILISGCAGNNDGNDQGGKDNVNNVSNGGEKGKQQIRDLVNTNNKDSRGSDTNGVDDIRASQKAANSVAQLNEVKRAAVIVTNNAAYVGAILTEGTQLSKQVEDKIKTAVRKSENKVNKVYVSVNPDFVNRMDGYVNDLNNGKPVRGLVDEFGETVRRVFPDAP
jgi:spore cortex protein